MSALSRISRLGCWVVCASLATAPKVIASNLSSPFLSLLHPSSRLSRSSPQTPTFRLSSLFLAHGDSEYLDNLKSAARRAWLGRVPVRVLVLARPLRLSRLSLSTLDSSSRVLPALSSSRASQPLSNSSRSIRVRARVLARACAGPCAWSVRGSVRVLACGRLFLRESLFSLTQAS